MQNILVFIQLLSLKNVIKYVNLVNRVVNLVTKEKEITYVVAETKITGIETVVILEITDVIKNVKVLLIN
jgi:hypothetical protein